MVGLELIIAVDSLASLVGLLATIASNFLPKLISPILYDKIYLNFIANYCSF